MMKSPNPAEGAVIDDARDAVVVGAGFAGLYMLHRLRLLGFSVLGIESAQDVGGTWFWNRYPGARCDVESLLYCYTFSPEIDHRWRWTERYATQPEILDYLNFVADTLDLRRDIRFSTKVVRTTWEEAENTWSITTDGGDTLRARFCILATGCLSAARLPEIPGIDEFTGPKYQTSSWPHEPVNFSGKRVGVIGTGSSGIQAIPVIAEQARHLTVFQRTPNFSIPAMNAPLSDDQAREFQAEAAALRERARQGEITGSGDVMISEELRATRSMTGDQFSAEERHRILEQRWAVGGALVAGAFRDLITNEAVNSQAGEFVRDKIRSLVNDALVADTLIPKGYPFGAKRLCVDTNYYATFNRDNVQLIDLKNDPIERITPNGIKTRDLHVDLDAIVFATGFDAMTGAVLGMDISGSGGAELCAIWAAGPKTFLGLAVADFPNLFIVTGPGSPSVLSNVVVSIEQHVDFIADCLEYMRSRGLSKIAVEPDAQERWVEHVNSVAAATLFIKGNSWYLGANIPGKPRIFMPYVGGVGRYRQICNEVASKGYEGFLLSTPATPQTAAPPSEQRRAG